ncbi:hypothetical protein DFH29DRAFT_1010308 [Suillus ampliporus]|nr:hypothetical protein DFH29DRAFT_1010308 [Suillus ampliporus]
MLRSFGETPTRKQQELHLLNRQARWPAGEIHHSATTWLASGITLKEAQVALLIKVKKLGKWPTNTQKLAIAQHHDRLQGQLDEFVRVAVTFLSDEFDNYDQLDGITIMLDTAVLDSVGSSSDDPNQSDEDEDYDLPVEFNPETMVIPLPSNIGIKRCAGWGVANLVLQERSLREGQANDALHAIRVNLADKAMLFHTTVWPAKSQAWSTRAWARMHSQLIHLALEKADLKATMVVADPECAWSKEQHIGMVWSIDVQGDSTNNDWMNECGHSATYIPLQC